MLQISGMDADRAEAVLRHLTFPAELDDVIVVFSRLGITTDSLTDEMGGSP